MTDSRLRLQTLDLRLKSTFTLSRKAADEKSTLIARWKSGLGEGAPSIHYGPTAEELQRVIQRQLAEIGEPQTDEDLERLIKTLPPEHNVARCALEVALLDQQARERQQPLCAYLGLQPPPTIESSLTITPGSARQIADQIERAEDFRIAKLKVGFRRDLWFVDEVLRQRDFVIRLDANGGWTVSEAVERLRSLTGYPIEFVEQPLQEPSVSGLDRIKGAVDTPIILDESILDGSDIDRYHEVIDGVNLKLARCGGVRRTLALVEQARAYGLKLMLGCMIESAVGITAAAHLSSLFDCFDLDAILLTENDPFWGAHFIGSRLIVPQGSGHGINRDENTLA